ncbi:hypothetical protein R6Q59_029963 [Mikania micrantha]
MGNAHWGLGIRLVYICICLVRMTHKCVGGGNLTKASCFEQEQQALLKFKHSIKDDHGVLSSWDLGNDCCTWEGVGCDDATGTVVSLHLRNTGRELYYFDDQEHAIASAYEEYFLVGDEVNYCLTELVNLKHLDLSGIFFQRSLMPEFIGSFKQLRYLNLSNTGFRGNIPHQIGNLSNLKVLDLSSSSDYSNDISWIFGLSKLEHLDLSGVDLSRTQHLDSLRYKIHSLLKLSLSGCELSVANFGSHHFNSSREIASIKHLDLSKNSFKGQLPNLFLNMTSLTLLDLSWNEVTTMWSFKNLLGMIPSVSELRLSLCNIQNINLSPTNLNSSVHSNIQQLDLSYNQIEGIFPYVLANLSSLLSLDLSSNSLNSSIPVMPSLLKLDISYNYFWKIEDVGIWRQCHIKELIASYNIIEGEMIGPSTNVSKCFQHSMEILILKNNRLNCSIPESFERLINLRVLDMSSNKLTHPIPKAIGELISLQELYLSQNNLIGPIPKFHGQLIILHLDHNQLSGCIPESLGKLTTLREIFLDSNKFTSLPVSIGRLTSLEVLSVYSNLLNGTIPNSIGQLTNLYLLDVSNNSLQGVVSEDHFANLSTLKYLIATSNNNLVFNISQEWIPPFQLKIVRLGSCKIDGGFPQWLRTQRELDELKLPNASIFGPLPTWLRHMPIISFFDLSHNKITGPLKNLPSIYNSGILLLQDNIIRGLLPMWLCKMKDLAVLDLSRNRLSGKIPKCLWNLPLTMLKLGSNSLSGVIPSSLGHMNESLIWLQLNDNNFNGELPQESGYFVNLAMLDLGENKFSGNIPEWIGENMTTLSALRLHKNNFTGIIPHSLCKCSYLQILDLAHNNLTGSIPRCFGELDAMKNDSHRILNFVSDYEEMMQVLKGVSQKFTKTLEFVKNMDLSCNELVGEIPEALTALDALVGLNLSYNHFSGGISKNIGNMKSLFSLDLSANELNGTIPSSMSVLYFLSYLNLSHNNLSGQIPRGNQLQTLTDPLIYADNPYLCGAPLLKHCSCFENEKTPSKKNYEENAKKPNNGWFVLEVMCGFATGFWGIIGALVLKKQWRHKLFMFSEETIDKIYVIVMVGVWRMKRYPLGFK